MMVIVIIIFIMKTQNILGLGQHGLVEVQYADARLRKVQDSVLGGGRSNTTTT